MSRQCRNWSGRPDDYFIGHTHTPLSREAFCCQFISIRLDPLLHSDVKSKRTKSALSLPVVDDVGVAVSRQESNLNNLFRLPTAFDITLKLEGM